MSKKIPGAIELIKTSWQQFIKTWNDCIRISIWILYIGVANFAATLLIEKIPQLALIGLVVMIVAVFASFWVIVRLIKVVFELEAGKKPDFSKEANSAAVSLILPLFFVSLLQGFITLGGMLLLIIPGIYLAVSLTFSQYIFLAEGKRGLSALQASRELVAGRWWATLWRIIASSTIFGATIAIISGLLMVLIIKLAGSSILTDTENARNFMIEGILDLFISIIQAAVVPLFIIFQVKLYHALKKTR